MFSLKQKNQLITGVVLVAELEATSADRRKFLSIFGYEYDNSGRQIEVDNVIRRDKENTIFFQLRSYEIPKEYKEDNWDITEDILINDKKDRDIKGIEVIEKEVGKILKDFNKLIPEWECENFIMFY